MGYEYGCSAQRAELSGGLKYKVLAIILWALLAEWLKGCARALGTAPDSQFRFADR